MHCRHQPVLLTVCRRMPTMRTRFKDIDGASRVDVSVLQAPDYRGIRRSSSVQSHTTMSDSIQDSEQNMCFHDHFPDPRAGARSEVANELRADRQASVQKRDGRREATVNSGGDKLEGLLRRYPLSSSPTATTTTANAHGGTVSARPPNLDRRAGTAVVLTRGCDATCSRPALPPSPPTRPLALAHALSVPVSSPVGTECGLHRRHEHQRGGGPRPQTARIPGRHSPAAVCWPPRRLFLSIALAAALVSSWSITRIPRFVIPALRGNSDAVCLSPRSLPVPCRLCSASRRCSLARPFFDGCTDEPAQQGPRFAFKGTYVILSRLLEGCMRMSCASRDGTCNGDTLRLVPVGFWTLLF